MYDYSKQNKKTKLKPALSDTIVDLPVYHQAKLPQKVEFGSGIPFVQKPFHKVSNYK